MSFDTLLLVISLCGLGSILYTILYAGGYFRHQEVDDEDIPPHPEQNPDRQARLRRRNVPQNEDGNAPRQMTRRELKKEMKRREKEEIRRANEAWRAEQRRRDEAQQRALQVKRQAEDKYERELEKRVSQNDSASLIGWGLWKTSTQDEKDQRDVQTLQSDILQYISNRDEVNIEDIAAGCHIPLYQTRDLLQNLQQSRRLPGILDDNGLFIRVTPDAIQSIATSIRQSGRMSLVELSNVCTQHIHLENKARTSVMQ